MKYLIILFALLFQYWDDTDVVREMKAHIGEITLAQNEGRAPGSEGEKAVASYVYETLKAKGVDMLTGPDGDIFGLNTETGDTLVSRNVMGMLQGYDATLRDRYIVVAARMDNIGSNILTVNGIQQQQIYHGANGNASGLAVMMEVAGQSARNSLLFKRSVIFLALGSSTSSFAGAWHFLHQTFQKDASRIDAMVNLDILGQGADTGLLAFTAGNEDLNLLISNLSSSLQPIKPTLIPAEPYPSDHQIFYAQEIPSVLFTTGRYPEHNTVRDTPSILDYDLMEREVEYIYNFLVSLSGCREGMPAFHNDTKVEEESDGRTMSWADCDVPPSFLGNINPAYFLERWVYQYLKYPKSCIKDGIQGRVLVTFTIEKDGTVQDVHVTRSVDPELDEAAIKVVEASPKWKAARRNGQKVACTMTIPVEFRLKKRK